MSSLEDYQSNELERPIGPSAVLDLSDADPEVAETIKALLGDDARGYFARRDAEELQNVQAEVRQLQEKYYVELRQQTIGHHVISLLRRYINSRAETPTQQ
jgi:hypothetical protein